MNVHNISATIADDLDISIDESNVSTNDQRDDSHNEDMTLCKDDSMYSSTMDIIKPIEQIIHRSSPRNLSKEFLSIPIEKEATIIFNSNKSPESISTASSSIACGHTKDKTNTIYLSCHSIPDSCTPEPREPPPRLVRSNSYTLECPSEVFIKHMELKGIDLSSELSDSSLSKALTSTSVTTPTESAANPIDKDIDRNKSWRTTPEQTPKASRKSHKLLSSSSPSSLSKIGVNVTTNGHDVKTKTPILSKPTEKVHVKKLESREEILKKIYAPQDPVTARSTRTRQRAQQLCIIAAKPSSTSNKRAKNLLTTNTNVQAKVHSPDVRTLPTKPLKSNFNEYNRLLQLIEERHTRQMNELLQRQQDEQRRLQREFCQQQEILERQISTMMLLSDAKIGAQQQHEQNQTPTDTIVRSTSEQHTDDFYSCKLSQTSIESVDQSSVCECDDTDAECL